jgi:hypothetical protein
VIVLVAVSQPVGDSTVVSFPEDGERKRNEKEEERQLGRGEFDHSMLGIKFRIDYYPLLILAVSLAAITLVYQVSRFL